MKTLYRIFFVDCLAAGSVVSLSISCTTTAAPYHEKHRDHRCVLWYTEAPSQYFYEYVGKTITHSRHNWSHIRSNLNAERMQDIRGLCYIYIADGT